MFDWTLPEMQVGHLPQRRRDQGVGRVSAVGSLGDAGADERHLTPANRNAIWNASSASPAAACGAWGGALVPRVLSQSPHCSIAAPISAACSIALGSSPFHRS